MAGGIRSLAKGRKRVSILLTAPADEKSPTVEELVAGIYASKRISYSDFAWAVTDSEVIDDGTLESMGKDEVPGESQYSLGASVFRYFDPLTGKADPADDALFAAVKNKGTDLWIYVRETSKPATDPWAAGDEIYLGGRVITDGPQTMDGAGFIKRRIPLKSQGLHENIAVGPATP